jgi:glutamine amidotransferase
MIKNKEFLIGIVDYNVGNVNSVKNAIEILGYRAIISNDIKVLNHCSHLILPGVGAFKEAIEQLRNSGLIDFLEEFIFKEKKPILGICVGMQLMFNSSSEDGYHIGLGWLGGDVKSLNVPKDFKLPHVGWNNIELKNNNLFYNIENGVDYYFDHTFECIASENIVIATTNYPNKIDSAINKNNIYAVQFHPEKSQIDGLRIFKNFIELC